MPNNKLDSKKNLYIEIDSSDLLVEVAASDWQPAASRAKSEISRNF